MVEINIKNRILDVEFNINRGELVGVFGESGSGKSTLLRVIAGLEEASGVVRVDNQPWLNKKNSLPPQKRSIGFVMQDFALFENMSVLKNLLYVNKDYKFAKKLLEMVNLWELKDRYPNQLSGGQKQRVALARAIIKKPKILLLDEPLSALHPSMRYSLQEEILKVHKEFNLTTILVSHDLSEIAKMAKRVINIKDGKITAIKELNNKNEASSLLAFIVDKVAKDNRYEVIINLNGSILKKEVSKIKFNSLNIGDTIEVGVEI